MIGILILCSLLIILGGIFLIWQDSTINSNKLKINNFDSELAILKSLSFLYLSKNDSIEDMLRELVVFTLQNKINTIILVMKDQRIFRFSEKDYTYLATSEGTKTNINYLKQVIGNVSAQKTLTSLEKYLIKTHSNFDGSKILNLPVLQKTATDSGISLNPKEKEWESAVAMRLQDKKEEIGFVFFFSKEILSEDDTKFLNIVGNILTLIIKRLQTDQKMDLGSQLKAVNILW